MPVPCFRSKKRFSQNFLNSPGIAKKIAGWAEPDAQIVLELGAGKGMLTRELARRSRLVYAVELDRDLCRKLAGIPAANIRVINQDILKLNLAEYRPDAVVGNLPYAITGPIMDLLGRQKNFFRRAVLTVQREYGNKLLAEPGTPEYDPVSIFARYHFQLQKCFLIPPKYFTPRPGVSSMVVRLEVRPGSTAADEAGLFALIRGVFRYRRKRLKNALGRHLGTIISDLPECLLNKRPGEITLGEYQAIHARLRPV